MAFSLSRSSRPLGLSLRLNPFYSLERTANHEGCKKSNISNISFQVPRYKILPTRNTFLLIFGLFYKINDSLPVFIAYFRKFDTQPIPGRINQQNTVADAS